mgnify:CR=1 FL=1
MEHEGLSFTCIPNSSTKRFYPYAETWTRTLFLTPDPKSGGSAIPPHRVIIDTEGLAPSIHFWHHPLKMTCIHSITYRYRPEGTRTPNPCLSRPPGLSRCCIPIPITDRLQPYSDSNREPEIWSHVGYQLPHRAIYKKLRSLTFVGTLKFYLIQIKII